MKLQIDSELEKIKELETKFNNSETNQEKLIFLNVIINELNTLSSVLTQARSQI